MTYDIHARTVYPNDPQLESILNEIHVMHSSNSRPWWACNNPPYPSRSQLDDMMVQTKPPLTLVIALHDGDIVGYDFHSPDGVLLAGFVEHHPSHQGYIAHYDEWALDIQRAMNVVIKRNTGGKIYHVTYMNPSIWYALEVVLGIPRAPEPWPQSDEPTPTDWPAYTGPPPPTTE